MSEIIKKEDVLHIAVLSKLKFSDDEAEKFKGELNSILGYIEKLSELDTENVEPTSHVLDLYSVTREDAAKPELGVEKALANAPEPEHGHFRVPRVIE